MSHVVAISGKKRAGKDTMAKRLIELGYELVKFADPLYYDLDLLGFTAKQVEEHKEVMRPIMQAVGDARRHFDPDYYAEMVVDALDPERGRIVISDLRFQNEVKLLRKWSEQFDVPLTLVRIERSDLRSEDRHKSECDLDMYHDWDMIVSAETGQIERLIAAADSIAR